MVPVWVAVVVGVVLLVVTAVSATLAVTQAREIARLRAELAAAEAEIDALEARLDETGTGGLGGLLDGLLGEDGDLGDLFGDRGEDGLEGLLDGLLDGRDGADLSACLGGGLDGLARDRPPLVADDLAGQVDGIAERVESLRGLTFDERLVPELLHDEAFTERITQIVAEDYRAEQAELDRRVLAALGAVDAGVALRQLRLGLVADAAGGFYSTDTGELVVRADGGDMLDPAAQAVLAHELQHAVADQNLGLPFDDEDALTPGDDARAGLALVEGDATLLMQRFTLEALDPVDQLALATDPSVMQSRERMAAYPQFLQRELEFPYTDGLAFVCGLHAEGGWAAVDAAYADPPTTTAQVMWPARYAAGEDAVAPPELAGPGGSWTQTRSSTLGAAELLWLFSAPGDDETAALDAPRRRAAAWAGGTLTLWTDDGASAVGVSLVERDGEPSLCKSMANWAEAAFPAAAPVGGGEPFAASSADQATVVVCDGQAVRVGLAPDLATARAVTG